MRSVRLLPLATLVLLAGASTVLPACGGSGSGNGNPTGRLEGQTDFVSAPPGGSMGGASRNAGGADTAGAAAPSNGAGQGTAGPSAGAQLQRDVEETDLYRLEGNRLYYLNSYRGLMVFDVTNVDQPKLLGRSPIYGDPVEMVVQNGICTVVVGDWYGRLDDGTPFHGSIARGLDATDPANIKVIGEARLGGWVRDARVVGQVLYTVAEDYGWEYGMWDYGYAPMGGGVASDGVGGGAAPAGTTGVSPGGGGSRGPKTVISSVSFIGGQIQLKGQKIYDGYESIFNVTKNAIMVAHDIPSDPTQPWSAPSGKSALTYVDISDYFGSIQEKGTATVNGSIGYGADNGRWNLDFADGKTAHLLANAYNSSSGSNGYTLSTVDFTDPATPVKDSELSIPGQGWEAAARFDTGRMYLAPYGGYYGGSNTTPVAIYDLSNAAAPTLAGQTQVNGSIWNFIPSGNRLFALGSNYTSGGPYGGYGSSQVSLKYLDVTNPAAPTVVGDATFGDGWAWTPAAGTFKAFIKDDQQGLVVLPFSGWSSQSQQYNNGVQLIQYTPSSIGTAGAAHTKGWVERGIFVNGRIVSLSDLALSVVDYSNHDAPRVVNELTLARNVVSARPDGATVAELSSDWWENDDTQSEMRVLPVAQADELMDTSSAVTVKIDGVNARAFRNGNLAYVVSNVKTQVPCPPDYYGNPAPGGQQCFAAVPQVQVVDLSNGGATLRGKATLPLDNPYYGYWGGWGWGWYGCYWWDWYEGADVVQVGGDMLAFRRWVPEYLPDGHWVSNSKLYVMDLANPDAPNVASTVITNNSDEWWGNMRAVGDKLYTTHYEWVNWTQQGQSTVRYYLDQIDLTDRAHPTVGASINVPGVLVGASATDPSVLYTIDYRWYNDQAHDELAVVKLQGNLAYLQSSTEFDGYVGNVFVQGNSLYTSVEKYTWNGQQDIDRMRLHQVDLTDPKHPVDTASHAQAGWGWLLGVEGDRAIVTSGWGDQGIDIYKLTPNAPPAFDQFVRTRGWWTESLERQNDKLFLSSGYWGVQTVQLK